MCTCVFCRNYNRYKWAVIMECGCGCHLGKGIDGHDSLCCEFPNGKKKNNPYKRLKSAQFYKDRIDEWDKKCEEQAKNELILMNGIKNVKNKQRMN